MDGESPEAALALLSLHGRSIACGGISGYNAEKPRPGPSNLFNITGKRLTMKGLMVRDWMDRQQDFETEVGSYFQTGKLISKETVVQGINSTLLHWRGSPGWKSGGRPIWRPTPPGR